MFTVAAAPGRDFVIKNVKYSVGGVSKTGVKTLYIESTMQKTVILVLEQI